MIELEFPKDEDLSGCATALNRLIDTYRLSVSDFAEGNLLGLETGTKFSEDDSLSIGRISFDSQHFYHALLWLLHSFSPASMTSPDPAKLHSIKTDTISYVYLVMALYRTGNCEWAHYMLDNPRYDFSTLESPSQKDILERTKDECRKPRSPSHLPPLRHSPPPLKSPRTDFFCLYQQPLPTSASTYCFLKRDGPYLMLAPFKVELLHRTPHIYIYRNIISHTEITQLKKLAEPILSRAQVIHPSDDKTKVIPVTSRITKTAWLSSDKYDIASLVDQRLASATNLDLQYAEALQIANYGIGGHYAPHHDLTLNETRVPIVYKGGNRIATVLIYLSSPQLGGSTVFEKLGITISPSERDAVFWYNSDRGGGPFLDTLHAGCPVLLGSKWVANKWFHAHGNEKSRPCGLSSVSEDSVFDSSFMI